MCYLQRVQNSCGHRNDHVSIQCWEMKTELSKSKSGEPVPAEDSILATPIADPDALREPNTGEDDLRANGFHATDDPHCTKQKDIRCLYSPDGFRCMVSGCERAN